MARNFDSIVARSRAGTARSTRRRILKLGTTGVSALAFSVLLGACGGTTATPTSAPAAAPTTAPAPTKAPAPTTAPAAAPTAAPTAASAAATKAPAAPTTAPAAAATTAPSTTAVHRGGTLIIGTAQQIQTLDPHKGGLRNNRNSWVGLYSFLTKYDDKGLPAPMVAESWDIASDELSWTFHLRKGVKFHNGREMTADDVKFSFDRIFDKKVASPLAARIKPVKQIDVVDNYTVKFQLTQPFGILAASIAPMAIVAKENADQLDTKPIGTGPFKLKEYVVGQHLDLDKFPDYWEKGADGQALPYIDAVSIRTLADTNSLFTSLSTSTVQAFWQIPEQLQVQAEKVATIQLVPSKFKTTYDEYFFQADAAPFNDKNVRMALLLALDKDAIAQAGYFGKADPRWNNNIIPPGSWAEDTSIADVKRDPAKAKQLFQAAGVTSLKFLGYTETPQFKPISEVMGQNLSEIGIKLDTPFTDLTTWFSIIHVGNQTQPWGNGDDGNAFSVNISVNPPEPAIPLASWGCHTHFGSHFCDEALAKAAADGAATTDLAKRKAAYATYQKIWQADVPAIITCDRAFTHAATKKVHGLFDDDGALNYRLAWMEQ